MSVRMIFTALICALCLSPFASTALASNATTKDTSTKATTLKKKLVPFTYDFARRETTKTGKPLLVFIGAEWCGACVQMKNNVIPSLKKSRLIKNVSFAMVDFDENRKLGKTLTNGGPIPQTILFCKDKKGWHTHKLVGGQNLENVESLIKESLAHTSKAQEAVVAGQKVETR